MATEKTVSARELSLENVPTDGTHTKKWDVSDKVFDSAVVKSDEILSNIDPQGHFNVISDGQYLIQDVVKPAPVQQDAGAQELDMIYLVTDPKAPVHRLIEARCRELERAMAREEGSSTDHVDTLMRNIVSAPGVEVKYTATSGPFIVPAPKITTGAARHPMAPIVVPIPKLVFATLEPVRRDQQERALEESVLKGSSSSDGSQH